LLSVTIEDAYHLEVAINDGEEAILIHTAIILLLLVCSQIFDPRNTMILVNHRLKVVLFTIHVGTTPLETNEFEATLIEKLDVTLIEMVVQTLLLQKTLVHVKQVTPLHFLLRELHVVNPGGDENIPLSGILLV